jgi:hypothetical protein
MNLMRNERPLLFFALVAAALFAAAIGLSVPVIVEFADTGLVPRLPTALLATGLAVAAVVCLGTGLILDLVSHVRREVKRLAYLQHPAPGELARAPTSTASSESTHGAS